MPVVKSSRLARNPGMARDYNAILGHTTKVAHRAFDLERKTEARTHFQLGQLHAITAHTAQIARLYIGRDTQPQRTF